jgi:hypothetical protein
MMRFGGGGIDGTNFSPGSVNLGQAQTNSMPYINIDRGLPTPFTRGTHTPPRPINFDGGPAILPVQNPPPGAIDHPAGGGPAPTNDGQGFLGPPVQAPPPPNVLGSESVRATGAGPYDDAYRQNLATFAGGQFVRPGGNLSFNPTGSLFGNPTGGGNAPVLGMPDSLVGRALSGNPFSFTPPPPPPPPPADDQFQNPLGWWRDQFLDDGGPFGGRGFMMDME